MRSHSVLACLLAAACATPSKPTWEVVQGERLERLYSHRRPAQAYASVVRNAPKQEPQQPRHIDQREPPVLGTGPRRFRQPPLRGHLAVGVGDVGMQAAGSTLDDHTTAWFASAGIETEAGAGLEVDAMSSDDDLFAGARINDGQTPAWADASLVGIDAFPHWRFDPSAGDVQLPLRVGAFVDWNRIDHQLAGVTREWLAVGPRLRFEPTWRLVGGNERGLDLVGRLGGDFGPAWFREHFHGGADGDSTWRWSTEAGVLLRWRLPGLGAELGYRIRSSTFDDLDSDLYGRRGDTDFRSQQLFLGMTWN